MNRDNLEVDLRNSVQRSNSEYNQLKDANNRLVAENEHFRNEVDKLR
jgi:hypothetical protein